jgi:hypothetical protein
VEEVRLEAQGELIRRRGGKKEKERRKKIKMQASAILTFYDLNPTGETVLPNIFQSSSNSTRGVGTVL